MASLVVCGFVMVGCVERARGIVHSSQEEIAMDPNPNTIRLPRPDPDFKLTPEERASIREGFDVDALERLLAAMEADVRPFILDWFKQPKRGEGEAGLWETPPITMGDPALQPLLDEVWATVWERYPQLLDDDDVDYPGKRIAKERRAARLRER
jgi:hypothetical protein